jgi:ankyrin repeat protein
MEAQDKEGATSLLRAAQREHREVVERLLDRGSAMEAQDRWECTPLISAAAAGHTLVVACLVDRKADIEARRKEDGSTPLMLAASMNGHAETVELLLISWQSICKRWPSGHNF